MKILCAWIISCNCIQSKSFTFCSVSIW